MPASEFRRRGAGALTGVLLASAALNVPNVGRAEPTYMPPGENSASPAGRGADLEAQFRNPPDSARPRVWWHWMNGNITKDGIAKDLAWMKRVGIGGAQTFDVDQRTPLLVNKRLIYMTPEWKDALRFAAMESDRLGLELAIASSPGWSETGGPWVSPADAMKKLVWSQVDVVGGRRLAKKLERPPAAAGPFQAMARDPELEAIMGGRAPKPMPNFYVDVAVLAVPIRSGTAMPRPVFTDAKKIPLAADSLSDGDLTTGIELARPAGEAPWLQLDYPQPQTVRSARLHVASGTSLLAGPRFAPRLEASRDGGRTWQHVAEVPLAAIPTTISFAPVTARSFRLVLATPPQTGAGLNFAPPAPGADMSAMGSWGAIMGGKQAPPRITELLLDTEPLINRVELKAGFAIAPDYYAMRSPDDANGTSPDRVIDLTSQLRPNGRLEWTPPPGAWRIIRMGYSLVGSTNHPAPSEATGLEVDKFDAAAVRRYLDHYLQLYRDAAGADFVGRKGIGAIVTDSIQVGAANWTPSLIAQFKRLRGYDPTPWLPTLTGTLIGSRDQSDKFLYDFRRTLGDLLATEHYGTIAEVSHANDLKVYGEAFENGRPALGDDIALRRYADVPMAALWTYPREQGPNPAYVADMKGAASVAHIYGQNLVAAESMTAMMAPWAFGPADLKRVVDLEFVTGVNRVVVHTSVHVPVDDHKPGLSLGMFGQNFNRQESWAELARPWVDYMARNSFMLQQGHNVADIAYFYGEDAPLTGIFMHTLAVDAPPQHGYDFLSADALMGSLKNDGTELVSTGGARYRALYLGGSSRMMTIRTLRRVAELVEGGATVIGPKPQIDPGLLSDTAEFNALGERLWPKSGIARIEAGRVIASKDVAAGLAEAGVAPDFRFTGGHIDSDIPFVHRKLSDGDSYFLVNRKNRAEKFEAHFRVTGKKPELWHAEDGTSEPVSYRIEGNQTTIPLTLAPEESVHVVFRKSASSKSLSVRAPKWSERSHLIGPWHIAFEPGRGAPAHASFRKLAPLNENIDQRIKYFSGVASYSISFVTPLGWKPGQPLRIDLGETREIAEVIVNGKSAGFVWHPPYSIDIRGVAKAGRNTLQFRVASLWVNRLIGDAQPGARKVTWTALPTYTSKAPLRRSGLIGPVTLSTSDK